ncbi:MAG: RagB/SusD family nutrient uptake outer membrane protein [Muribaculaceae bacterium]|nr:RagB/SusD family nutrient uptake outer membrane protein [Muribaculaceae bacterium]
MKFNKISAYILTGAVALGALSACNDDDFLEENPRTIFTTANSYETVDQVRACVTNLYVHIRYWYDCNFFLKGMGSDVADTPNWRASGNGVSNFSNWSSSSNQSNQIYDAMFQLVNYVNQSLPGLENDKLKWSSEAEKNELYGEMMFMRGYGYLRLGEMFGGVPLVTQFYETLKLDFVRSSRAETYQQAISDLEEAARCLPQYPSEAGRVAQGAAYHYLAEAYLALATINGNNKEQLNKSVEYADKVIAMHPLMKERFGSRANPEDTGKRNGADNYYPEGNVFFDLFQKGNQDRESGNTESLWVFQYDYDVYHEKGGNKSESARNWSPVMRDVFWKAEYQENGQSSPWNNPDNELFPGGNQCTYVGGRGVSFNSPTAYVIHDIWQNGYDDDMRNAECNIHRIYKVIDKDHSRFGQVVTIDQLEPSRLDRMYPVWTKWASIDEWGWDDLAEGWQRNAYFVDTYACRSAETYLLRAEAKFRLGNAGEAAKDINALRDRAKCSKKAQSSDITMQYILDERARELFYEEQRWATLLRMGKDGINSVNNHAMYIADQSAVWPGCFTSNLPKITKWELFPIPQAVIDSNTGAVIDQNEGWN